MAEIIPFPSDADAPSDTEIRFDNVKPVQIDRVTNEQFWRFVDQWLEENDGGDDAA